MILVMERLEHIVDADSSSLDARVVRAVEAAGECVVTRFTYWYTGKPPVYEARLTAPPAPPETTI